MGTRVSDGTVIQRHRVPELLSLFRKAGYEPDSSQKNGTMALNDAEKILASSGLIDQAGVERFVSIVGASTAFGRHVYRSPPDYDSWISTLYKPMIRAYRAYGLTGKDTLVIGSGWGNELPDYFRGTALDIGATCLRDSRERLPHASMVQADAGALPFKDHAFDTVVISLLLSQLNGLYQPYRKKILGEATRVAGSRIFIFDTTRVYYTERGFMLHTAGMINIPKLLEGMEFTKLALGSFACNPGENFRWISDSYKNRIRTFEVEGYRVDL